MLNVNDLDFFWICKATDKSTPCKKKKNIEPRIARRGLSSSVRDPVVFRYRNHETTRRMNRFTDFRLHYNGNSDGYWSWPRLSARESVSAFHCHWDKRGGDERQMSGDSGHENRDFLLPGLVFFPGRAANKRYRRLYREIRLDSRLPTICARRSIGRTFHCWDIEFFLHRSTDYVADSNLLKSGSRPFHVQSF